MIERDLKAQAWSKTRGQQMSRAHSAKKVQAVLDKTHGHCAYCGIVVQPAWTKGRDRLCVDHIRSRHYGGKNDTANLAAVCHRCNCMKRAKDLEEYRRLLHERLYASFTPQHIAHLESLGIVLPAHFPGYPRYLFWFEQQGLSL